MSRFYLSAAGDTRKGVTCGGHRRLTAHPRTWARGIRVELERTKDNKDMIRVFKTGGTHDASATRLIFQSDGVTESYFPSQYPEIREDVRHGNG